MKLTLGIPHIKKLNMTQKQKKIFIGICVTLLLIIIPYLLIQAKFLKKSSAKSVSSASDFYFSSNKLSELTVTKEEDDTEVINEDDRAQYVIEGWDGKSDTSFYFDIRDYENPLLYNKSNQKITYEITYEIVKPKNAQGEEIEVPATVTVGTGSGDSAKVINPGDTDTIGGIEDSEGETDTNEKTYNSIPYTLAVTPTNSSVPIEDGVTVRITIKTVDSPYPRTLGATIVWKYSASKSYLAEKGFKTTAEEYEGKNIKDGDFALVYDIGTEVAQSSIGNNDASNAVTLLKYSWDNEKLRFDRFDGINYGIGENLDKKFNVAILGETSLTYKDTDGNNKTEVVTTANMHKFKNVIIMDKAKKEGCIFFETVAYSHYSIIMYKRDGSITPLAANGYYVDTNNDGKVDETDQVQTPYAIVVAINEDGTVQPDAPDNSEETNGS